MPLQPPVVLAIRHGALGLCVGWAWFGHLCQRAGVYYTCESALAYSKQILVEESLKGWKEIEFEVIRDKNDHCFTVVPMENFDPLGIHTGESIVVAPIISLSKDQIAFLEDVARKVVRHIGIVGPLAQYATNLEFKDGALYVRITSAVLRNDLFMQRSQLIEKINNAIGKKIRCCR